MEVIRRIGKECFRYRISGVAMTACLVLSMLAAYYGVTIYKNMYMEYKEKMDYAYTYTTYFKCYAEEASDFPVLPERIECNLKILDCWIYADSMNATNIANISLYSSDENWPLVSGDYADSHQQKKKEPIIVLGQEHLTNTYARGNEQYYKLYGDEYRVVGVFGSDKSKVYDYSILLYWDCLGEHALQRLLSDNDGAFYLALESNSVDTNQIFETYIKDNYNVVMDSYDTVATGTSAPPFYEKGFCIVIYLFCFSCIAVVIQFWLRQRKHEMQICRAFGFTNKKILLRLIYSLGLLLGLSLVIFILCCLIINMLLGNIVAEYNLGFSWYTILPYTGTVILSIVLVSGRAVYMFLHKSIIENL